MKERLGLDVRVEEADLFGLLGAERDAAVDALTAGLEMPFVLFADKVVCVGDLDMDRIADALRPR